MMKWKVMTSPPIVKASLIIVLVSFCLLPIGFAQTGDVIMLVQKLKDKDAKVRREAAQALGEIKDARAVEPLLAALRDNDTIVRHGAARALGEIKDVRTVEPLIAALKDKETHVRAGAAWVLGDVKDARAVKPLITALKDKDSQVRRWAARALGKINDTHAVEPLIAVLKDKDPHVRRGAAYALMQIGKPAVEPLIAAQKSNDKRVRIEIAWVLGKIKGANSDTSEAGWIWIPLRTENTRGKHVALSVAWSPDSVLLAAGESQNFDARVLPSGPYDPGYFPPYEPGKVKIWGFNGTAIPGGPLTRLFIELSKKSFCTFCESSSTFHNTLQQFPPGIAVNGRLPLRSLDVSDASSISWSPDGAMLATASRKVEIWDVKTGQLLGTPASQWHSVTSVSWSPDGSLLAFASSNRVKLWDIKAKRLSHSLTGHTSGVTSVGWSPDGARLVSGSNDRTVKIWDVTTGRLLRTLTGHEKGVNSVSWSPDGARLASGSNDRTVRIWDVTTGRLLRTLTGHTNKITSVSWSPDGMYLASGDGHFDVPWGGPPQVKVKLWDSRTGDVLRTWIIDTAGETRVSWSPDGSWVAYAVGSGLSIRRVTMPPKVVAPVK